MGAAARLHAQTVLNAAARKLARAYVAWRDAKRHAEEPFAGPGGWAAKELIRRQHDYDAATASLAAAEDEFRTAAAAAA